MDQPTDFSQQITSVLLLCSHSSVPAIWNSILGPTATKSCPGKVSVPFPPIAAGVWRTVAGCRFQRECRQLDVAVVQCLLPTVLPLLLSCGLWTSHRPQWWLCEVSDVNGADLCFWMCKLKSISGSQCTSCALCVLHCFLLVLQEVSAQTKGFPLTIYLWTMECPRVCSEGSQVHHWGGLPQTHGEPCRDQPTEHWANEADLPAAVTL